MASLTDRLLSFARELQRATTFDELLEVTRLEVVEAVGYHHVWLFVADTDAVTEVRLVSAASAHKATIWDIAPVLKIDGDAMLEEIRRSDRPVVVDDARIDPRTNKEMVAAGGNRTIVNVPLRLLDRPFGAFGTGTFGDEGCQPPTSAQLDYLVAMAGQIEAAASRVVATESRTALARAEQHQAVQLEVSRVLASSTTLTDAAPSLLAALCRGTGWDVGELWRLDDAGTTLSCFECWYSPGLAAAELIDVTRSMTFVPGTGLPGRVWELGESVWIPDVTADPVFLRAPEVVQVGLRAAIGCPIGRGSQRHGVIVLLGREVTEPHTTLLPLLSAVGTQIAQFIERERAEAAVRASLEEKETLLKEIHHRVKNNLQFVNSLLALQAARFDDPRVQAAFVDSQLRMRAMAMIHEALYRSRDLARVPLAPHVESICANLYRTYGVDPAHIQLSVKVSDVLLDPDVAIPCGLVVNELISNALKHAFPAGRSGHIGVYLDIDLPGRYRLVVRDDGVGLPAHVDPLCTTTLGLQLVRDLAEQLGAKLEVDRTGGTCFTIAVRTRRRGLTPWSTS